MHNGAIIVIGMVYVSALGQS